MVYLKNANEVKEFVDICNKYQSDIDALFEHYIIDAKSYLGVLAILPRTFQVYINTDSKSEYYSFMDDIEKFFV